MSEESRGIRAGVIMAGGSGERFWPLSRRDRPKQLLHLTNPDKSMLAEAVERLEPLIPAEQLFVITSRHLADPIREAKIGIPDENILAEPCKRNTSGALAYATAALMARFPDCPPEKLALAVVTADHRIGSPDVFRAMVDRALSASVDEGALVTCGIPPTRPETGFGYIQASAGTDGSALPVQAFHEKPTPEKAAAFLAEGNFYWNSGMFFWSAGAFLSELDLAGPKIAEATRSMAKAFAENDDAAATTAFESLDDISIDYALMEKASKVLMIPGTFPWADVGLWPSLDAVYPPDADGNAKVGDPVVVNTRNSIVYNDAGQEIAVGVSGVDNLVVVVTKDAVLVVPKDCAGDVRDIVAELKARDSNAI